MNEIRFDEYKDAGSFSKALAAAGVTASVSSGQGNVSFVSAWVEAEITALLRLTTTAAYEGVGAWALVADTASVGVECNVTGHDAAASFEITLDGAALATDTDDSAPFAITFTPDEAGTYVVTVVAADGMKTGRIEIEVVA